MEENLSRRDFLKFSGLVGLVLGGCNLNKKSEIVYPELINKRVSYRFQDLCDTDVDWKDININVYIKPSELLWEYHKYNEDIFNYVKEFFKKQKINCGVVYSNKQFKQFNSSNEFGLEILDSKREKEDRYWQLFTGIEEVLEDNPLDLINKTSHAVTRAGVVLTYGVCESGKGMNQEEINIFLKKLYQKDKSFLLRNRASHFCHEILHCMGLFHPEAFIENLIEKTETPNIMLKTPKYPKSTEHNLLGYCLNPLQQKLIHSFIAGNNNYKAFIDSQKDLIFYIENLAEVNGLKLRQI